MKTVAFLCVANSARSQMAEGLARSMFAGRIRFLSAGSKPSRVNPHAITALSEIGIDISDHTSKSMDEIDFAGVDVVVTLCAEEVCPVVPGKTRKAHWPFPDPAGAGTSSDQELEAFRRVRDMIRTKLDELPSLLGS